MSNNPELFHKNEIVYVKTGGDKRAYLSIDGHGRTAGRYGLAARDATTGEPLLYASYPTHVFASGWPVKDQAVQSGTPSWKHYGWGPPSWKPSHQPNRLFYAYMLTGRKGFADTAEYFAQANFWIRNRTGTGKNLSSYYKGERIIRACTTFAQRAIGWALKAQAIATLCLPDDEPRRQQYALFYGRTVEFYRDRYAGKNPFGLVRPHEGYGQVEPMYGTATFQQEYMFLGVTLGMMLLRQDLTAEHRAALEELHPWMAQLYVGDGTPLNKGFFGDQNGWCWRNAALYLVIYGPLKNDAIGDGTGEYVVSDDDWPATLYANWAELWAVNQQNGITDCAADNKIVGVSGAAPGQLTRESNSWWAQLLTCLSYCVDFGLPGARAAFDRLVAADNWYPDGQNGNDGFRTLPDWGYYPRFWNGIE